jgi:cation transport protein ChaC
VTCPDSSDYGCLGKTKAKLVGYRRIFNKLSVRNWGTKKFPCPTLNLTKSDSSFCYGIAFEFLSEMERQVLMYLKEREGGFAFRKVAIQLAAGQTVFANVAVYEGSMVIRPSEANPGKMVLQAAGRDGTCIQYLKGVREP